MKKQTKVLLAAALFTLGASFSSMAAIGEKNGTWVNNEEGWQYVDKNGEYVAETWAVSYGKDYWINEDEVLGSSEWVKDDEKGHIYYAQSDGSMTINAWKYLYNFNDEDEEEDQDWYYFDAKGRMATGKQTIGDYTYYFDENGKMLTGWVNVTDEKKPVETAEKDDTTAVGNVVYCNEDGALVKNSWLHVFPWTDDQDDCYEGENEEYYYAGSKGKLTTGKKDVSGLTYFFDKTTGIMIEGWVVKDADGVYKEAEKDIDLTNAREVFWTNKIGYAAKNKWVEIKCPDECGNFWYYFDKTGKAFIATASNATLKTTEMTFENGENNTIATDSDAIENGTVDDVVQTRKIDGVEYYFNTKGEMKNGLLSINGDLCYLVGGAKQTGKVTLTDENENDYTFMFASKTENGHKKYVAVTGNYSGYCYNNGQLMKAEEKGLYKEITTGVGTFLVDYTGKIQKSTTKKYELENGDVYTYTFNTVKDCTEYSIKTATKVTE